MFDKIHWINIGLKRQNISNPSKLKYINENTNHGSMGFISRNLLKKTIG